MDTLDTAIYQVQIGNVDAYSTVVRRFQDMAVGYAYGVLGDFHLAQDAAQEAFIQAYLDLSKLHETAAFPGWFRKIVFTQCNRITRRKQLDTVGISDTIQVPDASQNPDDHIEIQEQKDQILAAIQSLPENERIVITLYYINEFTQPEIAAFLDLPETTINNRVYNARKQLKKELMTMTQEKLKAHRPSNDEGFVKKLSEMIAAIEAVRTGNITKLKSLIEQNPDLIKTRTDKTVDPKHNDGYFTEATLLHFVAGNPIRDPLPDNIVEVTQTLLDASADVDAPTHFSDWSWTTLGLVASGAQPFKQGFTQALIDTLINAGADVNWNNSINLYGALAHTQECQGQRDVAEMLYDRGAEVDLCFAAALGKMDRVQEFFNDNNTLKPNAYACYRPQKDRLDNPTDLQILEEVFVWACLNGQTDIAGFLLTKGVDANAIVSKNGCEVTALHLAAISGWTHTVKFLLENDARTQIKDSLHQATPLIWAKQGTHHHNRDPIIALLKKHGASEE